MTQTAARPKPNPVGDALPVPGDGVIPPPCWLLFPPSPVYPLISSVTVLVIVFVLVDLLGVKVLLHVVTLVELPPPPPVAVVRSVVEAWVGSTVTEPPEVAVALAAEVEVLSSASSVGRPSASASVLPPQTLLVVTLELLLVVICGSPTSTAGFVVGIEASGTGLLASVAPQTMRKDPMLCWLLGPT